MNIYRLIKLFAIISVFCCRPSYATNAPPNTPTQPEPTATTIVPMATNPPTIIQPPVPESVYEEFLVYKLAERIEGRVMASLKSMGTILGIILAVAVFFGATLIIDSLSHRVEKRVASTLSNDLDVYRKRLQDNLVDLEMTASKQRSLGEATKTALVELKAGVGQLEELRNQYSRLHSEVVDIGASVKLALQETADARENTAQLRNAVAKSAAGKLAVFSNSFNWAEQGENFINGTHFGKIPGRLFIELNYRNGRDQKSGVAAKPILIPHESITLWSDTRITFNSSPKLLSEVIKVREELNTRLPNGDHWGYEYKVESANV